MGGEEALTGFVSSAAVNCLWIVVTVLYVVEGAGCVPGGVEGGVGVGLVLCPFWVGEAWSVNGRVRVGVGEGVDVCCVDLGGSVGLGPMG